MIHRSCYEALGLCGWSALRSCLDFDTVIDSGCGQTYTVHILPEPLLCFRVLEQWPQCERIARVRTALFRLESESRLVLRHYLSLSLGVFTRVFAPELAMLGLDVWMQRIAGLS